VSEIGKRYSIEFKEALAVKRASFLGVQVLGGSTTFLKYFRKHAEILGRKKCNYDS